ncbi:MAG: hypothetical protein RJA57_1432 [Bacteroidota bacterium]|jgi:MFS family permease
MRIITRTVWILALVSLLADVASEMLYPVMPGFLREIGFSVLLIGILEGVAGFTAGISKGYFGKRSDESGLRLPFIKLGYLLAAVAKPLMAVFTAPGWIFGVRTLDRLGKGVRTAARDALLSAAATRETKARVFSFHRSMDTIGAALGPLLALTFLYWHPGDYQTLFYLAFIPGLLSVLLAFLLRETRHPVSTLGRGNFFSFFRYWRHAPAEFRQVVPGLLLFALFNSSDVFLLLITRETIGDQTLTISGARFDAETLTIAAYIFYNLVYALTAYPMGMLADRLGHRRVLISGLLLFALVYAGFATRPDTGWLFGLFALYGIYAAATEGIVKAWITNLAHEKNTATAIGFYTSAESICSLLASILAGVLWTAFGSAATFGSSAGIALLVVLYLVACRPRRAIG